MKPIRVLLADDHNLVRAGIRALLQNFPDIQVVAEAENGREAMALIRTHNPDVVLMDIAMPELNGLDATAQLVKEFPKLRIIILSMHANEEYVRRSLQAGAVGYLLKGAEPAELRAAMADSFRKLHPRVMAKNPVMFVVEVGSLLTTIVFVRELAGGRGHPLFTGQVAFWLWFTVLFANFAEALAEGRGKAQAETLQKAGAPRE